MKLYTIQNYIFLIDLFNSSAQMYKIYRYLYANCASLCTNYSFNFIFAETIPAAKEFWKNIH